MIHERHVLDSSVHIMWQDIDITKKNEPQTVKLNVKPGVELQTGNLVYSFTDKTGTRFYWKILEIIEQRNATVKPYLYTTVSCILVAGSNPNTKKND